MPWKSLSLGVKGKALSSVSLSTKGKFIPGDSCEIIDRDDIAHARSLNITPWRKVWNILSDIWDDASGKDKVTVVHKSWYVLANVATSELKIVERKFTFTLDGYYQSKQAPMPLEFYFATVDDMELLAAPVISSFTTDEEIIGLDPGIILCRMLSPCTYEIPENIRDIFVIQDFLVKPEKKLLVSDGNFVIDSEIERGKKGRIVFTPGVKLTRRMWVLVYTEKMCEEIVEKFGPMVGYDTVRGDEYDTYMDIFYLKFVQMFGPTNKNLQLGLTIMHNFPYARFNCRVLSVSSTEMVVTPFPATDSSDGFEYIINNNHGLPFRTENNGVWSDIKAGDYLTAGDILTKAIRCFDLKNYADLAYDFRINMLERFHKTVIVFNSQIDHLDYTWEYSSYSGMVSGFVFGDIVTGGISGAWGYVIQCMHGGTSGKLELRRVVGDFILSEPITDEHSNSATMVGMSELESSISTSVTDTFLARNKRTGSDFLALVWIEFAPEAFMHSTYATLGHTPSGDIESSLKDFHFPAGICESTALVGFHLPSGYVETDYTDAINHKAEGLVESDFGVLLDLSVPPSAASAHGGLLDYGYSSGEFMVNETITGMTSGASGVVTSYDFNGINGTFTLRMVRGIFQDGEQLWGESPLLGRGIVDGSLYS